MTSKSLFANLMKEDMKRRIWSVVLLALAFFLGLPLIVALTLEGSDSTGEMTYILERATDLVSPDNIYVVILTVGSAVVLGMSGFSFLYSRRKVDFFHSIPVRRELLFAAKYLNGLLIYLFTLIVNMAICLIIFGVKGYLTGDIVRCALASVGIHTLYYSMTYTVVVIAVMLTGNLIVSGLGAAVFLAYGPVLALLKEGYYGEFFSTYYNSNTRLTQALYYSSPVGVYAKVVSLWGGKEGMALYLVLSVIATIALIALAVLLYRKRPSEAAGQAMVFSISKPIIKFLLVLLLSLAGGIFFRGAVSNNNDAWFIFGLLFSLVISHAVIEVIYQFDLRGALSHKRQLLYSVIAVGAVGCIFRFDLFHFDAWLPKQEKVESMSVAVSYLDGEQYYMEYSDGIPLYTNATEYQLNHMVLTDFDAAYELAKQGVEVADAMDREPDAGQKGTPIYIKYTLKSGREVYRHYTVDLTQNYGAMKELYGNQAYKEAHYPALGFTVAQVGRISSRQGIRVYGDTVTGLIDSGTVQYLTPDSSQKQALLEAYQAELRAMTLEELREDTPIVTIQLEVPWPEGYGRGDGYIDYDCAVYPSFTRTLALLKELGFDAWDITEAVQVTSIGIWVEPEVQQPGSVRVDGKAVYYSPTREKSTVAVPVNEGETIYTDRAVIEQILPALVDQDYYWQNSALIEVEDATAIIYAYNPYYNQEMTYVFNIRKGMLTELLNQLR